MMMKDIREKVPTTILEMYEMNYTIVCYDISTATDQLYKMIDKSMRQDFNDFFKYISLNN